jgi:HSP20 family molecular chaperone IbpA
MSHFPVTHYRIFNDPSDRFFSDQLHLFDPWRDFDTFPTTLSTTPSSFRWINQPRRISRSSSSFLTTSNNNNSGNTLIPVTNSIPSALSEKFRVQLNVVGFNPETIKTRIDGRKVIVEAKQEDRQGEGDYSIREIRKTYDLPEHAGKKKTITFDMKPPYVLICLYRCN